MLIGNKLLIDKLDALDNRPTSDTCVLLVTEQSHSYLDGCFVLGASSKKIIIDFCIDSEVSRCQFVEDKLVEYYKYPMSSKMLSIINGTTVSSKSYLSSKLECKNPSIDSLVEEISTLISAIICINS